MRLRSLLVLVLLASACREQYDAERDAVLKQNLSTLRSAIAKYRTDTGMDPASLNDLVPKYIGRIPIDPLTQQANWRVTTEESVEPSADFTTATPPASRPAIVDVHSAAPGSDRDGVPYANY